VGAFVFLEKSAPRKGHREAMIEQWNASHSAASGAEGGTSNRNIPLLEFLQMPENNADENF
jgi:hypothetical protein